jgi:NMD protein affecting ribosome stability and mRNA decay
MPSSTISKETTKYKYKPPINTHEDYYEAKIQLRTTDEKLIRYVIDEIDKSNRVRISKVIKLKTGIDIYVSSRKFATSLAKKAKKRFNGAKTLVTKTLFSRNKQTSKDIYRVTVLIRLD